MAEIQLVRQEAGPIAPADGEAVRRVMFGVIDGLGEQGKKRWRRFMSSLLRLQPGEIVQIITRKERSGPFHRRHMLIETRVFDAQERVQDFEQFRYWLKVGAGFVDWMPGPKGGVVPFPKSIKFDKLEDDDMREFHENVVAFLRTEHAIRYLWPKLPALQREAAIESLLQEFNE